MNITIRLETPSDFRETEALTREAFWDLYKPGCDEHLILHKMRQVPAVLKELDFVAIYENKLVGHIIYSKAKVVKENNLEFEVLCLGPVSVLPEYQKKGIGSKLIKHSIAWAKKLGFKAIFLFGNPEYYHRFSFENAEKYKVKTSEGDNFDEFMASELYENSLQGIEGKFYFDPIFHVDNKELETFEKEFPYKEKHVTSTQLECGKKEIVT
jgi:predicted N-acetyltransferase YhbS